MFHVLEFENKYFLNFILNAKQSKILNTLEYQIFFGQ
jgi:hypothetical protein